MKAYAKGFLRAQERVRKLEERLEKAKKDLQDLCPHVHLDGTSAIPKGLSHSECTICDQSTYYMGNSG
jgi:hypothetical protein